ncbi:MAG TPA: hypothetical protein VD995_20515 [Azospirillum sp.]|nr:hypothetical protein [Azospirillum sp.]
MSEANAASQSEECELFIATQKDRKQRDCPRKVARAASSGSAIAANIGWLSTNA